jgi:hypothetical protein
MIQRGAAAEPEAKNKEIALRNNGFRRLMAAPCQLLADGLFRPETAVRVASFL